MALAAQHPVVWWDVTVPRTPGGEVFRAEATYSHGYLPTTSVALGFPVTVSCVDWRPHRAYGHPGAGWGRCEPGIHDLRAKRLAHLP